MKSLTIAHSASIILGLQDEIRRSEQSRYDHRLHGVLLVAHGMSCSDVSRLLGNAPRTVEYWVHRFKARGLTGLTEGARSGRPRRLTREHLARVERVLRHAPREAGLWGDVWNGKTLAAWLDQVFGADLGVRQCQRLLRRLEFRLRKPPPTVAKADAERQKAHGNTPLGGRY